MEKVRLILTVILLTIIVGCKDENMRMTEDFIIVNVTKSYPKKELILQDFLDVEYIPLETNEEFITAANIQAISEDVIILKNMGRTDGNIFVFDRKGKGLRTINRLGQGGEEYTNILGITLDKESREIYVNNHYSNKVLVYDLLGNYKRDFRQKESFFYDQIGDFDKDYLICHDGFLEYDKPDVKRNFFMLVSKQDGRIKEISIPYKELRSTLLIERDLNGNILNDWVIRNKQLIPYLNSWILIEPSADTIYRYSQNQDLKPFIVRTPSVQSMDPEVFLFPSVLTDRYYFMQTVKKEFDSGTDTDVSKTNLVYDKQENAIYESVVHNDDFIDKIPMNLMFETFMLTIVNNDEIAFMRKLEAFDLVEAYQKGKLKGRLKDIAAKLDEESNPVIMLAKYKK